MRPNLRSVVAQVGRSSRRNFCSSSPSGSKEEANVTKMGLLRAYFQRKYKDIFRAADQSSTKLLGNGAVFGALYVVTGQGKITVKELTKGVSNLGNLNALFDDVKSLTSRV